MPLAIASARSSATDQRANGRPRRDGNSQASALIAATASGGKAGRSPAARLVVEAGKPVIVEAGTPLAGDLSRGAETGRNAVVAETLARQQDDPGSEHVLERQSVFVRARAEFGAFIIGKID
jgi:hypothetical protein